MGDSVKKIQFGTSSVLTLAFLFSGNIIYGLYPSSGNPILSYICISLFLLLLTFLTAKYFVSAKYALQNKKCRFLAVFEGIVVLLPLSYMLSVYADTLGSFAKYYASVQVLVFAVIFTTISGICIARRGTLAVLGFARMTVWFMIAWIFAGWLGFAHTKNIVIPASPFGPAVKTDIIDIIKNTVIGAVDIVLLVFVLTDNKSDKEKKCILPQVLSGVWLYIAVSGINMLKNLLLFGADFLERLDNPDLAAIRLIPMFELPEISVVVNTAAVVLKISVYMCASFYMLKDAYAEKYSSAKVNVAFLSALCILSFFIIYIMKGNVLFTETASAVSLCVCAVMCMFFASKKKYNV